MQKQTIDIKQLENRIWQILARITDPEVPVLTILDLGIVREVIADDTGVQVSITPTYSGCPAMDMIATQIRMELLSEGIKKVNLGAQHVKHCINASTVKNPLTILNATN